MFVNISENRSCIYTVGLRFPGKCYLRYVSCKRTS